VIFLCGVFVPIVDFVAEISQTALSPKSKKKLQLEENTEYSTPTNREKTAIH
jgi:hypothetical protein